MSNDYDAIASVVLEEFKKLPAKRKPCVRDNGLREWVPLSGIVAQGHGWTKCVALATGMKCLPASKLLQANGTAIHDWHAEVLAIRAFNYFVLEECRRLISSHDEDKESDFIRRRTVQEMIDHTVGIDERNGEDCWHGQPFTWREDVTLHMYCSEAPCGDASMELIMAAQDDASPWKIPPSLAEEPKASEKESAGAEMLLGRGYFSQLGIVRRKPSRGDAPPSLSKSCSDKIALKQCTSLLCSLTSLLVSPSSAYITSLILPQSQYSPTGCRRCFSASSSTPGEESQDGRMKPLLPYSRSGIESIPAAKSAPPTPPSKSWISTGYAFIPFTVHTTDLEFDYSKRATAERVSAGSSNVASNLAVAWTANGLHEGLIGGVLQGRKKFDVKGASAVSRLKMWILATRVAAELLDSGNNVGPMLADLEVLTAKGVTYDEIKESCLLKGRRLVKEEGRREALKGWVRNTGDGLFKLSDL